MAGHLSVFIATTHCVYFLGFWQLVALMNAANGLPLQ